MGTPEPRPDASTRTSAATVLALLVALTLSVAAPAGLAQEVPPLPPLGVPVPALFMTAEEAPDIDPLAVPPGVEDVSTCVEADVYYWMASAAPVADQADKAYAARTLGTTCPTVFRYQTQHGFQLNGTALIRLDIGCDQPTAFYPGVTSGEESMVEVELFNENGSIVEAGVAYEPQVCDPDGEPFTAEIGLELTGASEELRSYEAGDDLYLTVRLQAPNPPPEAGGNLHFLVGSADHPSSILAPGLWDRPVRLGPNGTGNETDGPPTGQEPGGSGSGAGSGSSDPGAGAGDDPAAGDAPSKDTGDAGGDAATPAPPATLVAAVLAVAALAWSGRSRGPPPGASPGRGHGGPAERRR